MVTNEMLLRARIAELEAANAAAAADLRFLDAMELVARALRQSSDLEEMLRAVLDQILEIFACDRAWLLHPCDPEAAEWGVPMERAREGWPGAFRLGMRVPTDEDAAAVFAEALGTDRALAYDESSGRSMPEEVAVAFGVQTQMAIAIRPSNGPAWLLGIHHCATAPVYTAAEQRMFEGIADRMADALDSMLLLRDLQERERQIAQLQRAEAVGALAGGVAHDFNNKLLVILCYAELLREELPGGHPYIDQVVGAADGAADLTRQLLAFSRRAVLQPRPVDLGAIARSSAGLLRKAVGVGVQLRVSEAPERAVGLADPGQLEQVVVNLVINARDAMPDGGTISIETGAVDLDAADPDRPPELTTGRYATLDVVDDGAGMDEATRERIFEPFFTTKERGKGTGLGLSMAYGVARQSGGTLTVSSAPSEGSRFRVWLPATDQPSAEVSGGFAPVSSRGGTERLLLVDAEAGVGEVTARVLRGRGYDVTFASSSAEALALLQAGERFDLLLTEVLLSGLDGVELGQQALALQPSIQLTFSTGYSGVAIERLRTSGAARRLLQKPYTPDRLLAHVRGVLDGTIR